MSVTIGISLTCLLVTLCAVNVLASIGQEIVFAEEGEDDRSKQNSDNKKPVYSPQICNENELFYPGDQKNDYVCDCKPGHIYYPKTDRCYGAYRQGPCKNNEFLMITTGNYIPECLPNPCYTDGLVSFNNSCHSLDKAGPCEFPELSYVVGVNSNTLDLECIQLSQPNQVDLSSRLGEDCVIGSKRSVKKEC